MPLFGLLSDRVRFLMQRVLEPEVIDSWEEAVDYEAMDFLEVNTAFAQRVSELCFLDVVKVLDGNALVERIGAKFACS